MATNQTTNYQLNQWEPTDAVQRVDFNADNTKIDAVLAEKAEDSASTAAVERIAALESGKAGQNDLEAITDTVASISANLTKITFGSYRGNGSTSRMIHLGFQPKAVLLLTEWGAMTYYRSSLIYAGGFALRDLPARTINGTIYLTVTSSGFSLNTASDYEADVILTNYNGYTYYYIIFS